MKPRINQQKTRGKKISLMKMLIIAFSILFFVWMTSLLKFGSNHSGRFGKSIIDEEFLKDIIPAEKSKSLIKNQKVEDDDDPAENDDEMEKNGLNKGDADADDDVDDVDDGNNNKNDDGSTYLTMYGEHRAVQSLPALPGWLREYIKWNREVTSRPEDEEHKNKYLVLMCLPDDNSCGGLSDRFRGVFFYLFIAKITNRILCFYWRRPFPLETFFEPTDVGIRWSCPADLESIVNHDVPTGSQRNFRVYYWHDCEKSPRREKEELIPCVKRELRNIQNSSDDRFAITRLYGNTVEAINHLNMFAQMYSYKDMMPLINQWQHPDITEDLFRVLVKPKDHLARRVNATMTKLGLVENEYVSVHVRVRYPVRGLTGNFKTHWRKHVNLIDKNGQLPFEGGNKEYLVKIMDNAMECGHMLAPELPIYFTTDHNNATNFMVSKNFTFSDGKSMLPIGRQSDKMPMHVGIREFQNISYTEYYSVFEDLLIMGGSRCVSHGVGSFGSFGAGLSGNRCRAVHRKHTGQAVPCPNDRGEQQKMKILDTELLFEDNDKDWGGKIPCNVSKILVRGEE